MIKAIQSAVTALVNFTMLSVPSYALAGEIVLKSSDETVVVSGQFAGFQRDVYVVIYKGYVLQVPAKDMTCQGDDCLTLHPPK